MIENKKVLAVVTARANSQGLPGKNYRSLMGRPLFEWSVLSALECPYIDKVAVSSNCPYVADLTMELMNIYSQQTNAKRLCLVERPDEFATPTSKNEEALIHAYHSILDAFGFQSDIICNLQPTSPIRYNQLVSRCILKMVNDGADSLLTVIRETPFFWRDTSSGLMATYDYRNRPMRQQLKEDEFFFHDDGCVYLMTSKLLLEQNCRLGGKISMLENDKYSSMQIDTEEDFIIIEAIAEKLHLLPDYHLL